MVEKGADPSLRTASEGTPLHTAARLGHLAAVDALLRCHADMDAVDNTGYAGSIPTGYRVANWTVIVRRTPLFIAVEKLHMSVVRRLLERGAVTTPVMSDGSSLLHAASRKVYLLARLPSLVSHAGLMSL